MKAQNFTAAQLRAVNSDEPRILCVAGPGSGKTTVLTARIRRLIDGGTPPGKIVALTYTNAAARNLEERLGTWSEPYDLGREFDEVRLGFCGTLHGFALRMLRQHGAALGYGERTAVIDEDAALELLEAKAKLMSCKTPLKQIAELKKEGRPPAGSRLTKEQLVVVSYCDELKESGLLDFDLILTEFLRLLIPGSLNGPHPAFPGFTHLFVDEVQDSAAVDWYIFHALPITKKFFVGDPDQAIYGFRGGRPDLMNDYTHSGEEVIVLEENYRCGTNICSAANRLIFKNTLRIPKSTVPADKDRGDRVIQFGQTENEGDEIAQVVGFIRGNVQGYEPEEVAVLARTNAIAAGFRDAIAAAGIPVSEPPKTDLPKDWPLARALVEFAAQPSNNTLGFFYLVARFKANDVGSGRDARFKADEIRRTANSRGVTINEQWFNLAPDFNTADLPALLDKEGLCIETRMLIIEKIRALPSGAAISELALEVAKTDRPEEPESKGVTVTTIHAAKGREWDVVFLVGMEDQVIPGSAKSTDVEEERRVLFVGITRARTAVYFSHAGSRRATWGPKPIQEHRPSRFLQEVFP